MMNNFQLPKTVNIQNSLPCFWQIQKKLAASLPTTKFVVDCQLVESIDSAGIALLLELADLAKLQKREILLENQSQAIIQLCSLYQITL